MVRFAASIPTADLARVTMDARRVVAAGADALHIDIRDDDDDSRNLRTGPAIVQAARRGSRAADGSWVPLHVHLMVRSVQALADAFAEAGADLIACHADAPQGELAAALRAIRAAGCRSGLVFDPLQPLAALEQTIDAVDDVLILGTLAADGVQRLMPAALTQLERARAIIAASGRAVQLGIEGGVSIDNVRQLGEAGADTFVVGTSLLAAPDCRVALGALRRRLASPLARAA
ncbi:MAG: ribulose-phosphate 3-epimerase [Burkholderiaceae bacterium]